MSLSHIFDAAFGTSWGWRFVRAFIYISLGVVLWQLRPVPASQRALKPVRRKTVLLRHNMPRYAFLTALALAVLGLAGATAYGVTNDSVTASTLTSPVYIDRGGPYIGVFEPNEQGSYKTVSEFGTQTGHQPQVVLYYSNWNQPFATQFADTAHKAHATPLVDLLPQGDGVSMKNIAQGNWDGYLRSYAEQVRQFGYSVIIDLAPEMNGNWYNWGLGHTSPAQFVAGWQHVVDIFRAAGADNVTWLWAAAETTPAQPDVSKWWPGSGYVTWAGVDGYFYHSSDTFDSVFGTALSEIRALTNKPVFIPETAVGPGAQQVSQIKGLFRGIEQNGLAGFVWFDQHQNSGQFHLNWTLEGDKKGTAAFKWGIQYLKKTMNKSL
jgi:hypothetical protein